MFNYEPVGHWRSVDKDGNWEDVKWCPVCKKIVHVERRKEKQKKEENQ